MTQFDDLGAAYSSATLLDQFGEFLVFRPRGAVHRTIRGIVDRIGQVEPNSGPRVMIEVPLDVNDGVTLAELNLGECEIDVAMDKPTDLPTRRKIANISSPVGGMVTLEVY